MTLTFAQAIAEMEKGKIVEQDFMKFRKTNKEYRVLVDGRWGCIRDGFSPEEIKGQWQIVPDEGGFRHYEHPDFGTVSIPIVPDEGERKSKCNHSLVYTDNGVACQLCGSNGLLSDCIAKPEKIEPLNPWVQDVSLAEKINELVERVNRLNGVEK